MSLPTKRSAARRRRRSVARASAGISLTRLLAALGLLTASGALYGVTAADAFSLDPTGLEVRGAVHTNADEVRRVLADGGSLDANVFRVPATQLAGALRALPSVTEAHVRVALPDRLIVELEERQPLLIWQVGRRQYLVDAEGVRFALVRPGQPAGEQLPVLVDRRAAAASGLGGRVDATDLDAARRLAAITPAALGADAERLLLSVDDEEGWVMDAVPSTWRAVFGFYTPNARGVELIDQQAQCLAGALAGRSRTLEVVYLSVAGERCGTFREHGGAG